MSLRRLGVDVIDLWQLHRIDAEVPREEQFGALKAMQDEGKVRHVGLSRSPSRRSRPPGDRRGQHGAEPLQPHQPRRRGRRRLLRREGIGFIPWFPLRARRPRQARAAGRRDRRGARRHHRPGRAGLAAAAQPVMLPIPGTGSVEHLEENVAAADLELTAEQVAELDGAADRA
jgi:aryl-alcohol dehydrogenase-like predicted oxidoreductase